MRELAMAGIVAVAASVSFLVGIGLLMISVGGSAGADASAWSSRCPFCRDHDCDPVFGCGHDD